MKSLNRVIGFVERSSWNRCNRSIASLESYNDVVGIVQQSRWNRCNALTASLQSLNQVAEMIQTSRFHYAALAERKVPILETVAQAWLERLDATEKMIARMREAADVDFGF